MKWRYFIGAALVCAVILFAAGAPPVPVALGIVAALAVSLYQTRKV
jgi:hypothetical protein